MQSRTWITLLGALLLTDCAFESATSEGEGTVDESARESTQEIIGGVSVEGAGPFEQWEGIVQVVSSTGSCTAVFITASHLLTAGHCFAESGAQGVWLRAPTWDTSGWHSYPDSWVAIRGRGRADDVALISLPAPVPWATPARRFRLLVSATARTRLSIYGYGAYDQSGASDGALRTAPDGAKIKIDEDRAGYFKAEVEDARICWGDSGGPALAEGVFAIIWGVAHSFSYKSGTDRPCPTRDHEMTWTKVNANLPFIERELGFSCSRFSRNGQRYARCW